MRRRKYTKPEVELVSVKVKIKGKQKVFSKDEVFFSAESGECDLCGSHGSVTMSLSKTNGTGKYESYECEVHCW